jgi:hypothetical protein
MFPASENRVRWLRVAVIFLGLVLVFLAARFDHYFRTPMLEQGDIAVNALQVLQAKTGGEIYGNYSRFEFNHPGPAFFYVYAGAEWLLYDLLHVVPSPTNAHLAGCMILQSLFFALALGVLCAHLPWRGLASFAVLAAAFYFGAQREPWISIWPPHVLLMPFLCLLVAGASVGSGRLEHWPLMVLAGGFLFHGHVAQPLFVGLLGGLAVALSCRHLRSSGVRWSETLRTHRRHLVMCGALVFIFLLPLAVDLITRGTRSNLATILGRFSGNSGEHISLLRSLLYFLSFATGTREQNELLAAITPETRAFFAANAWRIAAWLAVLAVPPLIVWRGRDRFAPAERRFLLTAAAFLGTAILGCLLWGKAQAGGMHHFNGYFYYGVYYFGLLSALALLARALSRFPRLPYFILAIPAAVVGVRAFASGPLTDGESGLAVRRSVVAALAADPDPRPKLLVFEHRHWHNVATVALELQRRGVGFYVAPWWNFMFQPRHDMSRLGAAPEDKASIWWIAPPVTEGVPLTHEVSIHHRPGTIRPMDVISLRGDANGFRYVVSGVTPGNIEYAATNLPRVVVRFAPQQTGDDINVVFDAATAATRPSTARVLFNGEPIGEVTAAERAPQSVRIPREAWNRRPVATLELDFPQAEAHRTKLRPDYEWWTAWLIWAIRFEAAGAAALPKPN